MAKKRKKTKKKAKNKQPSIDGKLGRDNSGQFVKGHRISIGNKGPTNQKAKELKKLFAECVTPDAMKKICKKCIAQAKNGNKDARKEIFDRLWGKPIQGVEVGMEDETRLMFEKWLKQIDGSGIRSPIQQIRGKG